MSFDMSRKYKQIYRKCKLEENSHQKEFTKPKKSSAQQFAVRGLLMTAVTNDMTTSATQRALRGTQRVLRLNRKPLRDTWAPASVNVSGISYGFFFTLITSEHVKLSLDFIVALMTTVFNSLHWASAESLRWRHGAAGEMDGRGLVRVFVRVTDLYYETGPGPWSRGKRP
ncbi:hypothetical protein EVAR_7743_1 [Eumeta japonica]|uniref:Uncharacterized protein n=1 Tax=Eumeta variegata TaxID=151549 RepID=A0A4C1TLH9_EUMVA|nr:hypothetical protein EVAR_7743_1 [Eumeta japonica]